MIVAPMSWRSRHWPPPTRAAEWDRRRGDDPTAAVNACRALTEWVAADPPARLKTGAELAPLLAATLSVAPAEVNLMRGIAAELGAIPAESPLGPIVANLLQLRLDAERAAVPRLAEITAPWVHAEVAALDRLRRPAEDRLFSTDPHDRRTADAVAADCREKSRRAIQHGHAVHDAVVTWVRASELLTDLEPWLCEPADMGTEARVSREEIWRTARRLRELATSLGEQVNAPADPAQLDALARDHAELTRGLAGLVASYDSALQTLAVTKPDPADRVAMAKWWHAAEPFVACWPPVGSTAARTELVSAWYRVSRQLAVTAAVSPTPLEGDSAATQARCRDRARRLGPLLAGRAVGPETDAAIFRYEQAALNRDPGAELTAADSIVRGQFLRPPAPDAWAGDRYARITPVGPAATRSCHETTATGPGRALFAPASGACRGGRLDGRRCPRLAACGTVTGSGCSRSRRRCGRGDPHRNPGRDGIARPGPRGRCWSDRVHR